MMTGTDEQRELVQEALDRWGARSCSSTESHPAEDDPMYQWRIKSQANEDARSSSSTVDQIWELGLTVPDPALRKDEKTGVWHYSEPDWDELKWVVTGHGPRRSGASASGAPRATRRPGCAGRSRRRGDLGGLPPGARGPAVPARRVARGAQPRVRRGLRSSSTAGAPSRSRSGSSRVTRFGDRGALRRRRLRPRLPARTATR